MSPRRTLAVTRRLLAQFRHDRRTLAVLLVAPVVILGIFALLFPEDPERARLGVVDEDDGPLGAAIVDELRASELVSLVETSAAAGEGALEEDELDAYVVLPEGLTAEAQAEGRIAIDLRLRGTNPAAEQAIGAAVGASVPAALGELVPAGAGGAPRLEVDTSRRFGGEGDELGALDLLGGPFIGLLVFVLVYLVTSVSFLRERSHGTLERLMASPLRRTEIVVGYMLGFTLIALVQAAVILAFCLLLLGIHNDGNVLLIFGVEVLLAVAAINVGILLSTFARTEFQAVQFIPLVLGPQLLLSGVIVPVANEPEWLQVVSNLLPLTYAVDALRGIMLEGWTLLTGRLQFDLAVLAAFCAVVIGAAALTLRREVA